MSRIAVVNGKIIDVEGDSILEGNIFIEDGTIVDVSGKNPDDSWSVVDADGAYVAPGIFDMHVHLRDPGLEYKEDIVTGLQAAVAGGVTRVAAMPNTRPVNDDPSITRYMIEKAEKTGLAELHPIAAITRGQKGETLTEMGLLAEAGAVGFSDDGLPVENAEVMRRALEYSSLFGKPIIAHEEDRTLAGGGVINEGKISTLMGLPGIPSTSEEVMIARDVILAGYTGGHLHVCHVSTRGSVEIIRWAKQRGFPVTAEVAIHHLTLTEDDLYEAGYDTNFKMNPPLRTREDVEALMEGLADGTIDAIVTDHAPHARSEKEVEFDKAPFGIIGLQTLLPLSLKLWKDGVLTLPQLFRKLSLNPARILGLAGGLIKKGEPAYLTVFDLESYTFEESMIVSKSKNSPFIGWELEGKKKFTIVRDRVL